MYQGLSGRFLPPKREIPIDLWLRGFALLISRYPVQGPAPDILKTGAKQPKRVGGT